MYTPPEQPTEPEQPEEPEAAPEPEGAVLAEAVKQAPVQSAPVQSAALSDSECANEIIYRESRGDPWAENGRYKGIGQLDESYYPKYIGKTWAEVAGDYDSQYIAMSAYVSERYQTWQAAYSHATSKGWY
jgi:hypothetical protein